MTATFYVGDAVTVMNTLPEKSVDLILTSPPFLALRSYLPQDHPDKALEGGSQATPGAYIDWLLDVVETCARVLAPHGSLCFELGDTYSGSGGAGGDYAVDGLRDGQPQFRQSGGRGGGRNPDHQDHRKVDQVFQTPLTAGTGWPLAKSLSLIPESFRWAMVYGHNPFTGRQTEPWRLRNVIRWVRPNPPVGALGDKFRPATSELMVFCKAKDRFFDLDAVREAHSDPPKDSGVRRKPQSLAANPSRGDYGQGVGELMGGSNPLGTPPLDWWNVPLLDGDHETPYGPKPKPIDTGGGGYEIRQGTQGGRDARNSPNNPMGPPPLDWWKMDSGWWCGEAGCRSGIWSVPESIHFGKPCAFCAQMRYQREESDTSAPLDWWNIPPGGYPGAHYAVWPPELLIKPIKAMCPSRVCRVCGEASRRIVSDEVRYVKPDGRPARVAGYDRDTPEMLRQNVKGFDNGNYRAIRDTLGFSDCGHDDYRPGLVLDPFAGSGTTLSVATGHGRDAIGIDLDERNYELALDRVGPLILQRGEIRDGTGPPD